MEIQVRLTSTWQPSRFLNTLLLNLPRYLAARAQNAGDQRRVVPDHTRAVGLSERVLIPHALIHHETVPEGPDGDIAAVEEVAPDAPPPGRALNITGDDIRGRRMYALGFDPEKLQVLFDEVAAKLAGNEVPASEERSRAVARLIEHGTRAREALHYMLSYPMLTNNLEDLLGERGKTMPTLVREGGPLTDNHGDVHVQVQFIEPEVVGYFDGSMESMPYEFAAFKRNVGRTAGMSLDLTGGGALNTGDLLVKNPVSPVRQTANVVLDPVVARNRARTGDGGMQTLSQMDAVLRTSPWLRVSADAIVTVTLDVRNKRDWIDLPGGEVTVAFRVRHAAELGLTPEASVDLGLFHRGGIPVPSGIFFPGPATARPASIDDLVRAAFSLPALPKAFAVQIQMANGEFLAGNTRLTPGELADEIRRGLAERTELSDDDDPIVLLTPHGAVIPPGQITSPAQALADELNRPVLSPNSSLRVTQDGAVLAVHLPGSAETAFGHGWQQGNWVAVFPRRTPSAVREMTQDDLDVVAALISAWAPDPWPRWRFEEELLAEGGGQGWMVAEDGGKVVAYAGLSVKESTAWVVIGTASQQRGLVEDLLGELRAQARRRKATRIAVYAPKGFNTGSPPSPRPASSHRQSLGAPGSLPSPRPAASRRQSLGAPGSLPSPRSAASRWRSLAAAVTDGFTQFCLSHGFSLGGDVRDAYGRGVHARVAVQDVNAAGATTATMRPPVDLPYNLADALSTARRELGWAGVGIAGNHGRDAPGVPAVPPPSRDVHFGALPPEEAIRQWRQELDATKHLAAMARELLPVVAAADRADLERGIDEADRAVRGIPGPSAAAEAREAAWQDMARFRRAAGEFGQAAAPVVRAALTSWQERSRAVSNRARRIRAALPRDLPADLADAVRALDQAELGVPRPPQALPSSAAAMRPVADGPAALPGVQAVERAMAKVLAEAVGGWDERRTHALKLAKAAEGLIEHLGEDAGDYRTALDRARDAVRDAVPVAPPAPPPVPADPERSGWEAAALAPLQRLTALEAMIRAILRDSTSRLRNANASQSLQEEMAERSEAKEKARNLLPLTGARQAELTGQLDEAARGLEDARPAWWKDHWEELTTVEAIAETKAGLDARDHLRLAEAIRRFQRVVRDIVGTSNRTVKGSDRVSTPVREVLPYTGASRYALERMLERAEAGVTPNLTERQRQQRTLERMRGWQTVLAAATRELTKRTNDASALAARARELLPGTGARRDELAVRFERAFNAVRASQVGPVAMNTIEEIEQAARDLSLTGSGVELLESVTRAIITAAITEPAQRLEALSGQVADEADRLLEHAGVDPSELRRRLAASLVDIRPLLADQPVRPESVADLSRAEIWLGDIRRSVEPLADVVAQALNAGWQPRTAAARNTVDDVRALLVHTGDHQQALTAEFEEAAGKLSALADTPPQQGGAVAYLSAVGDALAPLTRYETAAGHVLTEASTRMRKRVAAALERAAAAQQLPNAALKPDQVPQRRPGEALQALRDLPGLPERPQLTAAEAQSILQRADLVTEVEQATEAVLTAATAPLETLRQRAAEASNLAEAVRTLLPHAGGQQADLAARLDAAVRELRDAQRGYWTSGLATAAQVEAVRAALAADAQNRIGQAAAGLQAAVQDVLNAAVGELDETATKLTATAAKVEELLQDTRPEPHDVVPGLADAVRAVAEDVVPGLADAVRAVAELALTRGPALPASPAALLKAVHAMAPLTDLRAALDAGLAAISEATRQEAAALRSLVPYVGASRGGLAENFSSAERGLRDLPPAPEWSLGTRDWIDATEEAVNRVNQMRSAVTALLNWALVNVATREDAAKELADATIGLLKRAGKLLPGAEGLENTLVAPRAGAWAPQYSPPDTGGMQRLTQAYDSIAALGAATEQVLSSATTGLAQRIETARNLLEVLQRLLPFTGERKAELTRGLNAAKVAMGLIPVLQARPRPHTGVAWVERAEKAFAALSRLAEAAKEIAAAAASPLDELRLEVAAAQDLAEAARQLLTPADGEADQADSDPARRLADVAARLASQQPAWWPANAADLTTAHEAETVIQAMGAMSSREAHHRRTGAP